MIGLLALAFGAGLVSAANPCGFAVLPAWIAYHLDTAAAAGRIGWATRLSGGLRAGLALTAGYAGTLVAVGLLITAGARAVLTVAPWLALVVGGLLVLAGLVTLLGRQIPLRLPSRLTSLARRGTGSRRLAGFGAGYAIASLGCTLALLLAVVAQALTTASLPGVLAVFAAYTLGAATLLLLLTTGTAVAGGALTRFLRHGLPLLHRATGAIMIAAGGYLIAYWLPATTRGGTPGRGLPNPAPLAGATADWLHSHQLLVVALAGLVLAATITTAVLSRHSRRRQSTAVESAAPVDAP